MAKVLWVGDSGVGKTSIIYSSLQRTDPTESTLSIDIKIKTLQT